MPENTHTNPGKELGEDFFFEQVVHHAAVLEMEHDRQTFAGFERSVTNWIKAAGGGARQLLLISPRTADYEVVDQGGQWAYRIVDTGPMYTRDQIIDKLTAEMGAPLGEKLTKDQMEAAGLPAYKAPTLSWDAAFGFDYGNGYVAFAGNWQQFPPHGVEARNPANGTRYMFWRRGNRYLTGIMFVGYWVLPEIFAMKENQRW